MAANPALVKKWIQYLKNNQIVKLNSDPDTGNLTYNRKVTSDDVATFLDGASDYTPDEISNAIHTALTGKAISGAPKSLGAPPAPKQGQLPAPAPSKQAQLPGPQQRLLPGPAKPAPKKKKINTDNATDVDYRDKVDEAFKDDPGYNLDEDDVEKIFDMLSANEKGTSQKQKPGRTQQPGQASPQTEVPPEQDTEKKQENIRKIKRLIRDTMTEQQRMALWRLLSNG